MDHRQTFKEAWLTSLMENLEEQFGEEERTKLMEECGRNCARRSSVHKTAESAAGNVSKLVKSLANFLGKENCVLENNHVLLRYGKCYCELVDKGPERLPDTYCLCSRGWIVEMFETAAQKPVTVDVIKTIKRGDPLCEFSISI
jgi:predicted hydrocarbon binding protein